MKTYHLLTGTNPPQFLSIDQLAEPARLSHYQPRLLAEQLRLTPRTFERRFRGAFGVAPRQWLMNQRMIDASDLLRRGLTPKEAAARLRFDYPQSLFRQFRRSFGCTPVQFQQQYGLGLTSRLTSGLSLQDTPLSLQDTPEDLPVARAC